MNNELNPSLATGWYDPDDRPQIRLKTDEEKRSDLVRANLDLEAKLERIIARCRQDASSASNVGAHGLANEILKIAGERT